MPKINEARQLNEIELLRLVQAVEAPNAPNIGPQYVAAIIRSLAETVTFAHTVLGAISDYEMGYMAPEVWTRNYQALMGCDWSTFHTQEGRVNALKQIRRHNLLNIALES